MPCARTMVVFWWLMGSDLAGENSLQQDAGRCRAVQSRIIGELVLLRNQISPVVVATRAPSPPAPLPRRGEGRRMIYEFGCNSKPTYAGRRRTRWPFRTSRVGITVRSILPAIVSRR